MRMGILHRYIAKSVMFFTLLTLLIVLALSFIIGLLTELNDVGVGDYGFLQAVVHTLLRLPYDLYQFFSLLVLLGGVMGLGVLATHQELIVMRASGFSIRHIVSAVLLAAFLLIFISVLVGEYVAPRSNYLADNYKYSTQNSGQAVATLSGLWVHEGNNFLHIDRVITPKHLEGVTRYEFDASHRLLTTYFVRSMYFEHRHWVLDDVHETVFLPNQTRSSFSAKASWDTILLTPRLLNVALFEPNQMSLKVLSDYIDHLVKNGLQAGTFQFEFWKRIFQPLTTLVMLLLAIPFVFAAPRSLSIGKRLVAGVMVGIIFYTFNAFLSQFSVVFQLSPFFAALAPTVIFGMIGYVLMRRKVRSVL